MGSRYTSSKPLDFCLNPVRFVNNGKVDYVPCGKCDGCLLHNANEWSMRLGCEIEDNQFSIFFTLTYMNKYLPTYRYVGNEYQDGRCYAVYTSDHPGNIRFDGKKDVRRVEDRQIYTAIVDENHDYPFIQATNYVCDTYYFPYSSKRDVQLYLKLLRKDIYEKFPYKTDEQRKIRYFIISEYGETLLRPHLHGVIFPQDYEISEYLLYRGLYQNWKMCREDKFAEFCHYCDSGCRGYVTNYLTCNTGLPQIYRNDFKPFRLASKNPAIGFLKQDKTEVFENISQGVDTYNKDISRIDERYVLRYSSKVGSRIFPKCYRYSQYDFNGLCALYGLVWFLVRAQLSDFEDLRRRLSKDVHSADWTATSTCFAVCNRLNIHPHTYVYCLDMWYYKSAMYQLKQWYEWQQTEGNRLDCLRSYNNFSEWYYRWKNGTLDDYQCDVFGYFCESFVLNPYDLQDIDIYDFVYKPSDDYVLELSDILSDMVKMPKFNEKFGFSPNSVSNF